MAITLREGLGRKLTIAEMDENFTFLSSSYVVNSITASMAVGSADSSSVAARATLLSADATASFADLASDARTSTSSSISSVSSLARKGSGSFSGSFEGDGSSLTGVAPIGGTGVTVVGTTVNIGQDVATTSSVEFNIITTSGISASAVDITGDLNVAGTASFGLLTSTTASSFVIGDARILLNADTPAVRFAGITVVDSGSDPYTTASFLYDGSTHDWKYEYESGGDHDAAVALFGPVMSDLTGSFYPVSESVLVGTGGHHVTSSIISVSNGVMTVEGTITETSALRYKENIQPLQDTLTKVNQLNPVEYDWIRDGKHDIGLIAEEINEIYPDLVETKEGEVQSIHYSRLTAVLIGAVKELTARVEELENK